MVKWSTWKISQDIAFLARCMGARLITDDFMRPRSGSWRGFCGNGVRQTMQFVLTYDEATCISITCPIGYMLDSSQSQSTSVTIANCCEPGATCATFPWPIADIRDSSHSQSTNMTIANCCEAEVVAPTMPFTLSGVDRAYGASFIGRYTMHWNCHRIEPHSPDICI